MLNIFKSNKSPNSTRKVSRSLLLMRNVNLSGKVAIVTGGNSGRGKEICYALAVAGARVILTGNSEEKCAKNVDEIKAKTGEVGDISCMVLDLSSLQSIGDFVRAFLALEIPLHLLICNAEASVTAQRQTTLDGLERHMGLCHVGHYLLTELLSRKLRESAPSRVVFVTNSVYKSAKKNFLDDFNSSEYFHPWNSYVHAKAAVAIYARDFDLQNRTNGVTAYSVCPGQIPRDLIPFMPAMKQFRHLLTTTDRQSHQDAAVSILFCAIAKNIEKYGGQVFVDCKPTKSAKFLSNEAVAARLRQASDESIKTPPYHKRSSQSLPATLNLAALPRVNPVLCLRTDSPLPSGAPYDAALSPDTQRRQVVARGKARAPTPVNGAADTSGSWDMDSTDASSSGSRGFHTNSFVTEEFVRTPVGERVSGQRGFETDSMPESETTTTVRTV